MLVGTTPLGTRPRSSGSTVTHHRQQACKSVADHLQPSTMQEKLASWQKEGGVKMCWVLYNSILSLLDPDPTRRLSRNLTSDSMLKRLHRGLRCTRDAILSGKACGKPEPAGRPCVALESLPVAQVPERTPSGGLPVRVGLVAGVAN